MIKILKNQSNNLPFTLNEKVTLTNPNFLLEIFSNQNHSSKVVRLSGDTSSNLVRYNLFPIIEGPTDNLEIGTVNLLGGTYDYFVWQTSASTLSLSAATSIIESGLLTVVGSGTTASTYDNNQTEYTFS